MKIQPCISVLLLVTLLSGCATSPRISYHQDVYPVLQQNCFACHTPPHGAGYLKTGLDLTSYESLMRGSAYGPVITPGNSRQSTLNMLVEGRAGPSMRMPRDRDHPLTDREITILRLWVDQGAKDN